MLHALLFPTLLFTDPEVATSVWDSPFFTAMMGLMAGIATKYFAEYFQAMFRKPTDQASINLTDANARKTEAETLRETQRDLQQWIDKYGDLVDEVRGIEHRSDDRYRKFRNLVYDEKEFHEDMCPLLETHPDQEKAQALIKRMNRIDEKHFLELEDERTKHEIDLKGVKRG